MQHINNGNSVISQRIVLGNNDSNVPNIRKNVENLIRSKYEHFQFFYDFVEILKLVFSNEKCFYHCKICFFRRK